MNPLIALVVANLIWGAASPIFKYALTNIPPFTLAFIRFFFAGLIFLPLCIKNWQKINIQDLTKIFFVGLFGVTINISFFFLGLQKTQSINAPVIASSGPVFIFLLATILLGEKPKLKVFTGMMIALAGVLIIILSPIFLDGKTLEIGAIEGNLFFLLATFGSVFQTLVSKSVLKTINAYQVSALSFLFGGLTFLPLANRELFTWDLTMLNTAGWVGIIFGVFFSSALAYYLYYYGVSKIKAQEVGIFTYIDPVIAVLIAIPLLHEYPSIYFIIGSILVFGGILLAEGRVHWHPITRIKKMFDEAKKIRIISDQLKKYI